MRLPVYPSTREAALAVGRTRFFNRKPCKRGHIDRTFLSHEATMTREDHLLAQVMEECAEVAHRCSKALRFGFEEVEPDPHKNPDGLTNRQRIHQEYNDLVATLALLDANLLQTSTDAITKKQEKIRRYLEHARENGRLDESVTQIPE